jgi:RNA recognition motif-containing protein
MALYSAGKRQREAERERRKREKQERLRRNRELRAQGIDPSADADQTAEPTKLPEVKLEDVVISVAPRPRRSTVGPVKLFVGGLSWDTNSEELRAAFARFGPILDATVITDRGTGRSRGFGFVTFEQAADAATAVKEMNGAELGGRTLKVNPAEAR